MNIRIKFLLPLVDYIKPSAELLRANAERNLIELKPYELLNLEQELESYCKNFEKEHKEKLIDIADKVTNEEDKSSQFALIEISYNECVDYETGMKKEATEAIQKKKILLKHQAMCSLLPDYLKEYQEDNLGNASLLLHIAYRGLPNELPERPKFYEDLEIIEPCLIYLHLFWNDRLDKPDFDFLQPYLIANLTRAVMRYAELCRKMSCNVPDSYKEKKPMMDFLQRRLEIFPRILSELPNLTNKTKQEISELMVDAAEKRITFGSIERFEMTSYETAVRRQKEILGEFLREVCKCYARKSSPSEKLRQGIEMALSDKIYAEKELYDIVGWTTTENVTEMKKEEFFEGSSENYFKTKLFLVKCYPKPLFLGRTDSLLKEAKLSCPYPASNQELLARLYERFDVFNHLMKRAKLFEKVEDKYAFGVRLAFELILVSQEVNGDDYAFCANLCNELLESSKTSPPVNWCWDHYTFLETLKGATISEEATQLLAEEWQYLAKLKELNPDTVLDYKTHALDRKTEGFTCFREAMKLERKNMSAAILKYGEAAAKGCPQALEALAWCGKQGRAEAYTVRGWCYEQAGKHDLALEDYKKASELKDLAATRRLELLTEMGGLSTQMQIDYQSCHFDKVLGSGWSSIVYKEKMGAVKKLSFSKANISDIEETLTNWKREIRFMQLGIDSPNIMKFVGVCSLTPMIAMELLNRDLTEYVRVHYVKKGVSESAGFSIALGIAKGLHTLHQYNVIHRDIKPLNILLREKEGADPEPVIADFGFALVKGEIARRRGGTHAYHAPELYAETKGLGFPFSKASDVYAFGMTLFWMYDSQNEWFFLSPEETQKRWKNNRGPNFDALALKCSPYCLKLIKSCCDIDPEKRPDTAKILQTLSENRNSFFSKQEQSGETVVVVPDSKPKGSGP